MFLYIQHPLQASQSGAPTPSTHTQSSQSVGSTAEDEPRSSTSREGAHAPVASSSDCTQNPESAASSRTSHASVAADESRASTSTHEPVASSSGTQRQRVFHDSSESESSDSDEHDVEPPYLLRSHTRMLLKRKYVKYTSRNQQRSDAESSDPPPTQQQRPRRRRQRLLRSNEFVLDVECLTGLLLILVNSGSLRHLRRQESETDTDDEDERRAASGESSRDNRARNSAAQVNVVANQDVGQNASQSQPSGQQGASSAQVQSSQAPAQPQQQEEDSAAQRERRAARLKSFTLRRSARRPKK
jgi:hypothetical protein